MESLKEFRKICKHFAGKNNQIKIYLNLEFTIFYVNETNDVI